MMLTPGGCSPPNLAGHPLVGGSEYQVGDHSFIIGEDPQREDPLSTGTTYRSRKQQGSQIVNDADGQSTHPINPPSVARKEGLLSVFPEGMENGLKTCPV